MSATLGLPTLDEQMRGADNADFTECGCGGVVERVANDYDGDSGHVGYEYLNGCGTVRVTLPSGKIFMDPSCAKCAAAEVAA